MDFRSLLLYVNHDETQKSATLLDIIFRMGHFNGLVPVSTHSFESAWLCFVHMPGGFDFYLLGKAQAGAVNYDGS